MQWRVESGGLCVGGGVGGEEIVGGVRVVWVGPRGGGGGGALGAGGGGVFFTFFFKAQRGAGSVRRGRCRAGCTGPPRAGRAGACPCPRAAEV